MKKILTVLLVGVFCASLAGCSKKADEAKTIEDVKAEAAKMDTAELQKMADTYKDAIAEKTKDVEAIQAKLKEIPLTEMLGDEAKGLKDDLSDVQKSVSDLTERMDVYLEEAKKKAAEAAE